MTLTPLFPHPASAPPAALAVLAGAALAGDGGLRLNYRITGADALRIPVAVPPAQADGLWRHTCCEAFVAAVDVAEYREFNLSPSGRWAAYRFTAYRARDAAWQSPTAPSIALRRDGHTLELAAVLPAALLPAGDTLDISLTVVAEDCSGAMSYWAPAHAGELPDFHQRSTFTLRLERP